MPSDCAAFYGVAHGVVSVEVASSEWELKLQDLLLLLLQLGRYQRHATGAVMTL
jgi:hypothetical protein